MTMKLGLIHELNYTQLNLAKCSVVSKVAFIKKYLNKTSIKPKTGSLSKLWSNDLC